MISLSQEMFLKDHHWIAYNSHSYELSEGDIYFFRKKEEAKEFAENNVSDFDNYKVIYASSIMNLINQLSYGNSIGVVNRIEKTIKANFMNEENLNSLKENLRGMGFCDKLFANLEHNIRQCFPEFVLKMNSEFGKSKLESTLFFSRSIESNKYFFYRYDAKLKNDVGAFSQSFDVKDGKGVTLKEAFNLLEGRAVFKEMAPKLGEKYHAWIQLDLNQKESDGNYRLKQFPKNHDYDLKSTLQPFPIKKLLEPQKAERLLLSLQKGNKQLVTMMSEGKEQKYFVQADPEYKAITVYDYGSVRPLTKEQKAELIVEGRQKLNGKEVHIEGEQQGNEIKQEKEAGKQKQDSKNEDSLLPKNRTSKKNGLAIR